MTLLMFGCEARLVLDLDGEEHDVSALVRQVTTSGRDGKAGWTIDATALIEEITVERRARDRAKVTP